MRCLQCIFFLENTFFFQCELSNWMHYETWNDLKDLTPYIHCIQCCCCMYFRFWCCHITNRIGKGTYIIVLFYCYLAILKNQRDNYIYSIYVCICVYMYCIALYPFKIYKSYSLIFIAYTFNAYVIEYSLYISCFLVYILCVHKYGAEILLNNSKSLSTLPLIKPSFESNGTYIT